MDDQPFADPAPDESLLAGAWLPTDAGPAPDVVEQRIRWLIADRFECIACTNDGWSWLFRDPRDGRLWELTFPAGMVLHSGPRRLSVIDAATASDRYPPAG